MPSQLELPQQRATALRSQARTRCVAFRANNACSWSASHGPGGAATQQQRAIAEFDSKAAVISGQNSAAAAACRRGAASNDDNPALRKPWIQALTKRFCRISARRSSRRVETRFEMLLETRDQRPLYAALDEPQPVPRRTGSPRHRQKLLFLSR